MTKYFLLLLTYFSLVNQISGQTRWIGIKAGPQSASAVSAQFSKSREIKDRKGNTAAIVFEKTISKNNFFELELMYDERGYSFDIEERDIMGNKTGNVNPASFHYDYISIPVKIGITTGETLHPFVAVGLSPGVLYKGVMILPKRDFNTNLVIGTSTYDNSVSVRNIDLSGMLEAGLDCNINEKMRIFASCRYMQSFVGVKELGYMINAKVINFSFSLSGGIKFNLDPNKMKGKKSKLSGI